MIDKTSWITVYPELVLVVMACVVALVDLGVKSPRRTLTYVLTMAVLAVVALMQALYASGGETAYGFGNMVVSDAMGNWLKCFATLAVMVSLVYGRPYAGDRDMLRGGELFSLSMFALVGMFVGADVDVGCEVGMVVGGDVGIVVGADVGALVG